MPIMPLTSPTNCQPNGQGCLLTEPPVREGYAHFIDAWQPPTQATGGSRRGRCGQWNYRSSSAARAFYARWETWATRSRLKPMIHVAGIIRRHLENILNYLTHRITNAVTEGAQRHDPVDRVLVARLPESGAVQAGHLLHCGGLALDPR